MEIVTRALDVDIWPKLTRCHSCNLELGYTQDAVYIAQEFEREGGGTMSFWVDCPICKRSINLGQKNLPPAFRNHLLQIKRKKGDINCVTIVGNDPRNPRSWPMTFRCLGCRNHISVELTDLLVEESFDPDGRYAGLDICFICPVCARHQVVDEKLLPVGLAKGLKQTMIKIQKKTTRYALLQGDRSSWEAEIQARWGEISDDSRWTMSGELFPVLEDRILVAQQCDFNELSADMQERTIRWLMKRPNVWPYI